MKLLIKPGAHNPERATSMYFCYGVFSDQFLECLWPKFSQQNLKGLWTPDKTHFYEKSFALSLVLKVTVFESLQ